MQSVEAESHGRSLIHRLGRQEPDAPPTRGYSQATRYNGWLSIEPHIKAAIHAGQDVDDSGEARAVWVEYTRRLEKLVKEVTG